MPTSAITTHLSTLLKAALALMLAAALAVAGAIAFGGPTPPPMASVSPAKPSRLVGFSSGGGFVLRFAGSPRQDLFQRYLLLSPYLGPDAPNYRPNAGGWVRRHTCSAT